MNESNELGEVFVPELSEADIVELDKAHEEFMKPIRAMEKQILQGYPDFEKADRPNRASILAEPRAIMEKWFTRGVTYGRDVEMLLPPTIKPYVNMPDALQDAWELAAGKIKRNILRQKGIPIMEWPDVIFRSPAIPLDILKAEYPKISHELKAGCGTDTWIRIPPLGTVYETEHLPSRVRAEKVSDHWYDLELYWQYIDITRLYTREGWQWGPNPYYRGFVRAIERRDEIHRKLTQSGLSVADQFVYACRQQRKGFQYEEVKKGLRQIGIVKSIDEIKKSPSRNEGKLIELGLLKKQWPACQDPGKYEL